ncbi:MAG: FtsX-like permease family protein [Planctomycetota bacterium]|nr:MAG: FtsX-like permease family protein [Planctomycetota bacterium]
MAIPFKYNFRNLLRRKIRTILTLLGIALVVWIMVFTLAFARGLKANMKNNGDPDNIIILSAKAGTTIWFSAISRNNAAPLKYLDGVKSVRIPDPEFPDDREMDEVIECWSPEVQYMTEVDDVPSRQLISVHGVDPARAFHVNSQVRITKGAGPFDNYSIIIGSLVAAKLGIPRERLAVGRTLHFKDAEWTITGTFTAPGTMMDSEIWCHHENIMTQFNRKEFAMVKLKAVSPAYVPKILAAIKKNRRYQELAAYHEPDFFKDYASGHNKFSIMAIVTAVVIAVGGIFTGINTMYTAVVGRIREIGMLQVIGFSKAQVLLSFIFESLIISATGGLIGCLAGLAFNGIPLTLTWFAFELKVDFTILAIGFATALVIGVVGAFFPALQGIRMRMVDAMRYN